MQQMPPPPPGFQIVGQPQAQQPAAPRIIPGTPRQPSPIEVRQDQRAERGEQRAQRGEQRQAQGDLSGLWREFNSDPEVRQFRQARVATTQLRSLAQSGRPADDLALIFSFMRALDPNSTVREGEFALAQGAAGVPDRIRAYYEQARSGRRLTPEQRSDMVQTAYRLYLDRARSYNEVAENYRQQGLSLGGPESRLGRMFPVASGPRTEERRRSQPQGRPGIRILSRRPAQ